MISKQRKPSQAQSIRQPNKESPEDAGYSSSEYSPMHNGAASIALEVADDAEDEADTTADPLLSSSADNDYYHADDMSSYATTNGGQYLQSSSYVPPGYIFIDSGRGASNSDYSRFNQFSVSSL